MPRTSYREHRASRDAAAYGSETELESLASYSTYTSQATIDSSTYLSQTGSYPTSASPAWLGSPAVRHRALSNTSTSIGPSFRSATSVSRGLTPDPVERIKRRARIEEKRRRAQAKAAAYDSPIRRWAKWLQLFLGWNGTLIVALIASFLAKLFVTVLCLKLVDPISVGAFPANWHSSSLTRNDSLIRKIPHLEDYLQTTVNFFKVRFPSDSISTILFTQVLLDAFLNWSAALMWVTTEGHREGRTLRTRVAALAFILLQPVSVMNTSGLFEMSSVYLGLVAWSLVLLSSGNDVLALAALALSASFDSSTLVFLPAISCYLIGKCIWLGRRKGTVHFIILIATVITATMPFMNCNVIDFSTIPTLNTTLSLLPLAPISDWTSGVSRLSVVYLFRLLISTLALIPGLYRLLRASFVLHSTPTKLKYSSVVPPTVRLLPHVMAISALAFSIGFQGKEAISSLVPLSFLVALRGEEDTWNLVVQLHHVVMMSLFPRFDRQGLLAMAGGCTLAWSALIGAYNGAPKSLVFRWHRRISTFIALGAFFLPFARPHVTALENPRIFNFISPLQSAIDLAALAFFIGCLHVRLLKDSWAIGGLE